EEVEDLAELRVRVVDVAGPIPRGASLLDLVRGQAEEEEVLGADLLADLDVGPVEGPHGQSAVERELHVPGPRRLLPGERDLLGDVGGGIDALSALHVEAREE